MIASRTGLSQPLPSHSRPDEMATTALAHNAVPITYGRSRRPGRSSSGIRPRDDEQRDDRGDRRDDEARPCESGRTVRRIGISAVAPP